MVLKSIFASVVLLLGASDSQDLEFGPKPGSRLVKEFESNLTLKIEELTIQYDANEPLSALLGDGSVSERRHSVLIDDYSASSEHPAIRLLRTFEALELEQEGDWDNRTNDQDFHHEYSGRSPLEGKRVRFIAEAEPSTSTAKFDCHDEHDERLLEGLVEDVDWQAFLPSAAQRASNTWKVDAAALRSILVPGGRIGFVDTHGAELKGLDPGFIDALEGTLQVDFAGSRDLAERKVAVLRVHGKPTAKLAPLVSEGDVQLGMGYTAPGTNTVNATLELDLTGEILWDLENRHLHAASLAADVVVKRETRGDLPEGPLSVIWIRETWGGHLKLDSSVTRK